MARRKDRFDNGSISLNRPKLSFRTDEDANPIDTFIYPIRDSNRVIEEYMLLANHLVAKHLVNRAQDLAVLRHHPPPPAADAATVAKQAATAGFALDFTSSSTLQSSLKAATRDDASGRVQQARAVCLSLLFLVGCGPDTPGVMCSSWNPLS